MYKSECFYNISIHALREEGDQILLQFGMRKPYFYPRPPRGGRLDREKPRVEIEIISIHALREEGDTRRPRSNPQCGISIHALREEGDDSTLTTEVFGFDFYPRPPRGGRLIAGAETGHRAGFLSTPSARRATGASPTGPPGTGDFYPRPPRGGRLAVVVPSDHL